MNLKRVGKLLGYLVIAYLILLGAVSIIVGLGGKDAEVIGFRMDDFAVILLFGIPIVFIVMFVSMKLQGETEWEPSEGETVSWDTREYNRLSGEDKKKYLEWKTKIQAKIDAKEKLRRRKRR